MAITVTYACSGNDVLQRQRPSVAQYQTDPQLVMRHVRCGGSCPWRCIAGACRKRVCWCLCVTYRQGRPIGSHGAEAGELCCVCGYVPGYGGSQVRLSVCGCQSPAALVLSRLRGRGGHLPIHAPLTYCLHVGQLDVEGATCVQSSTNKRLGQLVTAAAYLLSRVFASQLSCVPVQIC